MNKVYYLNKIIYFGSQADFEDICSQNEHVALIDSAELAKLELFSDSAKPIAMISEDSEAQFQNFCESFEIIEAAGGVVVNPSGDTLMIFRNGKWDLPKGKLEPAEKIEECAIREVKEECGIDNLELGEFRAHTYHIYMLDDTPILKKTWWWNMNHDGQSALVPQTEEGITGIEWATPEKVTENLKKSYQTIKDLITGA